jgi:CheY-like chemotaxis protein
MPHEDGFWLAQQIRSDPKIGGATIMMLSSSDLKSDSARCRALGIALYLVKPVTLIELRRSILEALGGSGAQQKHLLHPLGQAVGGSVHPGLRPSASPRVLLAEDNPANQKLL